MPTASGLSAFGQPPIGGFLAGSGVGQRMDAVLGFLGGALLVLVVLAVGALVVAVGALVVVAVASFDGKLRYAGMAAGIVVLVAGLIAGNYVVDGVGAGITLLPVLGLIVTNAQYIREITAWQLRRFLR